MASLVKEKLGPADYGQELTYEEFMAADYQEGYHYELIEGKLYVSPQPNPSENINEEWLKLKLQLYAQQHPEIVNYVSSKARIFIPKAKKITCPEPDIAAYEDYPLHVSYDEIRWEDTQPFLVVEVLSPEAVDKDLVRNVELYWRVPAIREYWIVDVRESADRPTLLVYRRWGQRWVTKEYGYGEVYTTRLLAGFSLKIDPRS